MHELVAKLMDTSSVVAKNDFTRFRIGIWPIVSDETPELAMGIATVLGYLLEQWPTIKVYRLFLQADEFESAHSWEMKQSQFSVDDWQLDELDDNIGIWGSFRSANGQFMLKLSIENDLANNSDHLIEEVVYGLSLVEVVNQLPVLASKIAERLDAGGASPLVSTYEMLNGNVPALEKIIYASFRWELRILQILLNRNWQLSEQIDDYRNMVEYGTQLDGFGSWVVVNSAARLVLLMTEHVRDSFAEFMTKDIKLLNGISPYSSVLALALYKAGYRLEVYDLLEEAIEAFPDQTSSYLALAHVLILNSDWGSALNVYQRGIEAAAASVELYFQYANLLMLLLSNNISLNPGIRRQSSYGQTYVEDYVLIGESTNSSQRMKREVIAAYRTTLELEPENIHALSGLIIQMADLQDPHIWKEFSQLVSLDTTGEYVRNVADNLYNFDDLQPAISILVDAVEKPPLSADKHINLAILQLLNEEDIAAKHQLHKAMKYTDEPSLLSTIERLLISADEPDFEESLGDITQQVDAGNKLSSDDAEYLEEIIERAPHLSEAYSLLGSIYLGWGEISDALDVLLDGHTNLPDDPDIACLLAKVLWKSSETELAFSYLNKSIAKNPLHVPSLALAAQLLFDDGQRDAARAMLKRAQNINPDDSTLRGVKVHIANNLNA